MTVINSRNPALIPQAPTPEVERKQQTLVDQPRTTRTAAALAQTDTTESVTPTNSNAGSTPLQPVALPAVSMSSSTLEGAESFGYQLEALGRPTDNGDLMLARFLKLYVLAEAKDGETQGIAQATKALLMKASILASMSGALKKADELDGQAQQLVDQAKALAGPYKIESQAGGAGDGGWDGASNSNAASAAKTVLTYENGEMSTTNSTLQAAMDLYAKSLELENQGKSSDAEAASTEALDLVGKYANANGPKELAKIDGEVYELSAIPADKLKEIVILLAQADQLSSEADGMRAGCPYGEAATYQRKGGYLVDSQKRADGHQTFVDSVMQTVHGKPDKDEMRKSLQQIEETRSELSDLLLEAVAKKQEALGALYRSFRG